MGVCGSKGSRYIFVALMSDAERSRGCMLSVIFITIFSFFLKVHCPRCVHEYMRRRRGVRAAVLLCAAAAHTSRSSSSTFSAAKAFVSVGPDADPDGPIIVRNWDRTASSRGWCEQCVASSVICAGGPSKSQEPKPSTQRSVVRAMATILFLQVQCGVSTAVHGCEMLHE